MNKQVLHNIAKQGCKMLWEVFFCVGFLLLFACSSEDEPTPGPGPDLPEEDAYLSFAVNIGDAPITKAYSGTDDPGTLAERFVSKVRIVLYDKNSDVVAKSINYDIQTSGSTWTGADLAPATHTSSSFVTVAKKVSYKDYKMLVIVNPTTDLEAITAEGKSLADFEAKQQLQPSKTATVGGVAVDKNFVMTNSDDLVDVLAASNLWDAKYQAHSNPVTVHIERMVAKVTFQIPGGGTTIPVASSGAYADKLTWGLDITNKWTYWMRVGANGPSSSREDWYGEDPNYSGFGSKSESDRMNEFNYYLTTPQSNAPSSFPLELNDSEYCLENTMDAADQSSKKVGTRVLIRCVYRPANVSTEGEGYFVYKVNSMLEYVFTLANMKTLQQTVYEKNQAGVALKEYEAGVEMAMSAGYDFSLGEIPKKGGLAVTESFKTGDLRYYHGGVNYYAIRILHSGGSDTDSPGPRHYGVLRNVHYMVYLTQIKGPGAINLEDEDISTRSESSYDTMYTNISAKIVKQ